MESESNFEEYFNKRIYSINHQGMSQDEMIDGYKDWTQTYEQDLERGEYSAPRNVAIVLNERYSQDVRQDIRILDVGAGTGLVADELHGLGFKHIDALDPIKDMLDKARQKGIYENYYEEFLSEDEPTTNLQIWMGEERICLFRGGSYDCITGAGCFAENHIPWGCLFELLRIAKPGGLIVIGTKEPDTEYLVKADKFVDQLAQQGKLAHMQRIEPNAYRKGKRGLTYVLTAP